MIPRARSVPLLIAAAMLSLNAQAVNPLWFLDHSPVRNLSKQDLAIMTETVDAVLADARNGETRSWKNPETGASGDVQALKSFEHDGLSCRRIALINQAKGQEARSVYDLCEVDGAWKILAMPD